MNTVSHRYLMTAIHFLNILMRILIYIYSTLDISWFNSTKNKNLFLVFKKNPNKPLHEIIFN